MQLPSIKEITSKAQNAFNRFPVTLVWAILGSFYIMHLIGVSSGTEIEDKFNIILTLILGISWLIGTQFYIEQQRPSSKWIILKLIVLVLLFLFYWHLPDGKDLDNNPVYIVRFFLYLIAGHLFLLFAPFVKYWNKSAYWNYLKSVGIAITRSALFSGVLYLGLVLALLAIDALFEAHIKGERYGQLFIFCLGTVNTWIYLSDFPKKVRNQTEIHFEKALEVFVKFILIPLVILYIVILYAYGTKILIEWQLPKGWVSYLVTALALIGYLVQIIINPIQQNTSAWTIKRFYPWFYYALLPLIVLLFVAIFRRISDYGITENRYFVVLIAIWIFAMALYLLVAKKRRLIILPLSLFALALLSSFGFWGVFSVSNRSQATQFKKVYKKVMENKGLASYDEFNQLTSIIEYLEDRKEIYRLDAVTGIHMDDAMNDTITSKWRSYNWVDTKSVLDSLGISIDPKDNLNTVHNYGTHYSFYENDGNNQLMDVTGYSHFLPIYISNHSYNNSKDSSYSLEYYPKDLCLKVVDKESVEKTLQIELRSFLNELSKKGPNLNNISVDERSVILEKGSIRAKLVFHNLSFRVYSKDSLDLHNGSAYMFIKNKNDAE